MSKYPSIEGACFAVEIVCKDVPKDDNFHTTSLINKPDSDQSGRIKRFSNTDFGVARNWITNKCVTFKDEPPFLNGTKEIAQNKAQQSQINSNKELATKKSLKLLATMVNFFNQLPAPKNHPYLEFKEILIFPNIKQASIKDIESKVGYQLRAGNKILKGECLLIPFKNLTGEINSFQLIDEFGVKTFLAGLKLTNSFFITNEISQIAPHTKIFIAEGLATALSVKQALPNSEIAVAGSINRLITVALELRQKTNLVIVLADLAQEDLPNRSLLEELKKINIPVKWPQGISQKGADYNDLNLTFGPQEIINQLNNSPNCLEKVPSELKSLVNKLLKKWIYIENIDRFILINDYEQQIEPKSFEGRYLDVYLPDIKQGEQKLSIIFKEVAIKGINYFLALDYKPKQPRTVKYLEVDKFNIWQPSQVSLKIPLPSEENKFVIHIEKILGKDSHILLDFLAHCVQKPTDKIQWSIILQGKQGIGKSYLGLVMKDILGESNVSFPAIESVNSEYNPWLEGKQLIVLEEFKSNKMTLTNKLKNIITAPTVVINNKYVKAYVLPNLAQIIAITNDKQSLILEKDDRRFCCLYSSIEVPTKDYFKDLFTWTKDNLSVIAGFLKNRDLTNFNPTSHAPSTKAKDELINLSQNSVRFILDQMIKDKTYPFNIGIFAPQDVVAELPENIKGSASSVRVVRELTELGALFLGRTRCITTFGTSQIRLYAIDEATFKKYDKKLVQAGAFYDQNMRSKTDQDILSNLQ